MEFIIFRDDENNKVLKDSKTLEVKYFVEAPQKVEAATEEYRLFRVLGDKRLHAATIRQDGIFRPNHLITILPEGDNATVPHPGAATGESEFQWRGGKFVWKHDKVMKDLLNDNKVVAKFTRICFLISLLSSTNRRGVLTIYPPRNFGESMLPQHKEEIPEGHKKAHGSDDDVDVEPETSQEDMAQRNDECNCNGREDCTKETGDGNWMQLQIVDLIIATAIVAQSRKESSPKLRKKAKSKTSAD
jgi:hypothetical protein